MGVVDKDGRADRLACCLVILPDKRAAVLIAIESLGQRHLERAPDTGLSLEACRRAFKGAQWAYEKFPELPEGAETQAFCQQGCPDSRLTSQTSPASHIMPFYRGGRRRG